MDSACCYRPSGMVMENPPREHRTLRRCPKKYQQLHGEYSVTFRCLGYTNNQLFGTRLYLVTRYRVRILPPSVLSCRPRKGGAALQICFFFLSAMKVQKAHNGSGSIVQPCNECYRVDKCINPINNLYDIRITGKILSVSVQVGSWKALSMWLLIF